MRKNIKYKLFIIFIFHLLIFHNFAQTFGPELITGGDFGTTETAGKNGDNGEGSDIYPEVTDPNIPLYYQPVTRAYHNGNLVYIEINPGLTIGKPLVNNSGYTWGLNEVWDSDAYFFPDTNGNINYSTVVPHAPNNGFYIVGTTTNGMYNLPSLNSPAWYEIYDRYETNFTNPTNYFLITNADWDDTKLFFQGRVAVTPGQAYRMSADISRLNNTGGAPNIDFIISTDGSNLSYETPVYTTGSIPDQGGEWITHYFDYIAPCNADSIYVAFRNAHYGGTGNDVALDNLSMRAIYPQIVADTSDGCAVTLYLDGSMEDILDPFLYRLSWELSSDGGTSYTSVSTLQQYTTNTPGIYRLVVYTDATENCPIYSNTIILEDSGNNCVFINSPEAIDDTYQLNIGQSLTANILTNDIPSDGISNPEDVLKVTHFTINDTIYPAGSTVIIYNISGFRAGVLELEQDGTLIFEGASDYFGAIPPIGYTIVEEGGGQDSAYVYINVITYEVSINVSCVCCPITIKLLVPDNTITDYSLYRYDTDELVVNGEIVGDSLYFVFNETNAGIFYYTIHQETEELISVFAIVGPDRAIWAPNTVLNSRSWLDYNNWYTPQGYGSPKWCTDVVIPENSPYYPELQYQGFEQCKDILFEHGAAINQIHRLLYRRAFVRYTPVREKWTMLSAPLKYIYSADFSADPTWGATAGIDPKVYMRYFNIAYENNNMPNPDGTTGSSTGSFSMAFSDMKERLTLGLGFALNVGTGSNSVFQGTFNFPRLNADSTEVEYKYHYTDDGSWIEAGEPGVPSSKYPFYFTDPGEPGRGNDVPRTDEEWRADHSNPVGEDSRYRFIYETSSSVNPFTITLPEPGTTNIVGNPFMSHIDFDELYASNSTAIYNYYRIWDGSGFYSYITTGGMDNETTWSGLPEDGLSNIYQGSRYIAPMQAFFVEMQPGQNQLTFIPDNIAITPMDTTGTKLKNIDNPENILKLNLQMGDNVSKALIGVLPLATDNYNPKEDVYKLFSYNEDTPEIYTIADGEAIEINAISDKGDMKLLPIGIKTSRTGKIYLSFDGVRNFTAFPHIYLLDTQTGTKFNLKDFSSILIEKENAANIEGRLYLMLTKQANNISESKPENTIHIFLKNNFLQVSSPLSALQEIEIIDMVGRSIYKQDNINNMLYTSQLSLPSGIYIIKVKNGDNTVEQKIKL
ncbi:MAG: T9SS type A sorting domain-containing protein [Candidatus Azobacteroides sp.]|nr:T9SS type A sorting domain-containing protein [Candidatus Azobacteroides sp.]